MKKILIGAVAFVSFAVSVYAMGHLTGSSINGQNKVCYYSDGSALTVHYTDNCPNYSR